MTAKSPIKSPRLMLPKIKAKREKRKRKREVKNRARVGN